MQFSFPFTFPSIFFLQPIFYSGLATTLADTTNGRDTLFKRKSCREKVVIMAGAAKVLRVIIRNDAMKEE